MQVVACFVVADFMRLHAIRRRFSYIIFQGYGHRSVKLNSLDAPIVYDIGSHFKGELKSVTSDLETSQWRKGGVKAYEYRVYRCLSSDIVRHRDG